MATAGSLDFVLTANSTQLRQELGKVRQESQSTALAITNLFSGDTINAVGFKLARGTITGLISDIDEMNAGLSITDSLTRNLGASFGDMGDIALLQLGQIAQFLGDDLFQTPLAGLQSASLERVGLGQLEGAYQVLTAGSNAAKIFEAALTAAGGGVAVLSAALEGIQTEAEGVSNFFRAIADNAKIAATLLAGGVQIIDSGIDQLLDSLAQISPEFRLAREAAKAMGVEFSLGKVIFGDYLDRVNQIDEAASTAANASQAIANGAASARKGVNSAGEAIDNFGDKLAAQQRAAAGFESSVRSLADAGQLLDVYNQVNNVIEGFTGSLEDNFNAAKGAETLGNQLELVSNSAGGAREDLAFVSDLTQDLGINFDAAAQGYVKFSTAANLANLSVEETKLIFEGISQATSVMGLSVADTQGVFMALQQSLSSGNVQLEELNQLAERIPGTFQAAAAALGVTTGELKGLISSGSVDSADFLPKFAEQLKTFTESGVVDAMNSGEAAVNRFNNALGNFQVAAGQAWLEVGTPALNTFSEAINFAAENEQYFSTIVDSLVITSIGLFITGIGAATVASFQFIKANKTASIQLFGNQLKVTGAQLAKFAGGIAVAYAATLVFYSAMEILADGGKETRTAIESLNQSLIDLAGTAKDSKKELENLLPDDPPPVNWLDGIIVGLNKADGAINKFVGLPEDFLAAPTGAQKQLDDRLDAIKDFREKSQEILNASMEFRTTANDKDGTLTTLKETEEALKRVEKARLAADPKDQDKITALAAEEVKLIERQAEAKKKVQAIQAALANDLAQATQELQKLEIKSKGDLDIKAEIEAEIKLIEKEKAAFDELTKASGATAESITAKFEKSSKDLDKSFSDAQLAIEEALASGTISQEKAQQQQLEAERKYLDDRLKLNRDAAAKLKAELENNAKLKLVDPTKALSAEEEKGKQEQLEKIDLDIAKTRIDIAKNTQTEKKQLNEQELKDIREAQAEAEAIAQRTENSRIIAIKERQSTGKISEEQAAKEIEAVQKESIASQITAENAKLTQIEDLKKRGVLTTEQAAEQESEVLSKLSDLNLQRIDAELQARKAANDEALQDLEDGIKQAEAAINQSKNGRQQGVAKGRLNGSSEQEAAQESLQIEQDTIAQTIALKRKEIENEEEAGRRGLKTAREVAAEKTRLTAEIGDLALQQINNEIQGQQSLIAAVQEGASQQSQAVELAASNRITAVKESLAQGLLDEEEAARRIAEIQSQSVDKNLEIKRAELAEIQKQRETGELTIKEAADRERAIIGEISGLKQQAADADIAAAEQVKQAKAAAIEQEIANEQAAAEFVQSINDRQVQALENQNNLLSAQSALLQAQTGLTQQRLQNAIEEAEAKGETNKAEELKKKLVEEQIRVQEQQARIDYQQLKLKQEQTKLEMQNRQIQAETAAWEAQINLEKARQNGATLQEIGLLERILGARNNQLAAINSQIASQQKVNALEEQSLRLKQQQTKEALAQANVKVNTGTTNPGGGAHLAQAGEKSSGFGGGGGGSFNGFGQPPDIVSITDKLTDLGNAGDLSTAFQTANLGLKLKLGGLTPGGLGSSAPAFGGADNGAILGKLDQMISATKASGGRPNLSISNVNDLGLAGQIYGDISRDSFRSAGL